MKVTIEFKGNNLDDFFDIVQELADEAFEGVEPEYCDFKKWSTSDKPIITVKYDKEEE